jgi:hypothetical protein
LAAEVIDMSLIVAPGLIKQARTGKVNDAEFVDCVRKSLPFAWSMLTRLVSELCDSTSDCAVNHAVPQTTEEWGQMFRMVSSNAIRGSLERHFGVRLAFQNCCTVAVFNPAASDAFDQFTSTEAQLLNQSPELLDC